MDSSGHSPARYLVTGGAGFIGSHLVDRLLARGDEVVALDNFDQSYDPALKHANLAWALCQPGFRLERGDVRSSADLDSVLGRSRFDAVVHLAARAGVRPSIVDPQGYDSVNVCGTTSVLDAVRRHGVPHLVLASSSSVYGATSVAPFREDQPADRPSSPYAATKRANELAAYAHHHLHGTSVACLRFFTVYGPRQRPEMAIHKFARMIEAGETVELFGDGSSRRDYTYVGDIVEGVVAAVDRPRGYRVYNLGTTSTIPLRDLVEAIGECLGRQAVVAHQPCQPGDVPLTHADIGLARAELGYQPTTTLRAGLAEFVFWLRARPATPLGHLGVAPQQVIDLSERVEVNVA